MKQFKLIRIRTKHGRPKYAYKVMDDQGQLIGRKDSDDRYIACFVERHGDTYMMPFWFSDPSRIGQGYSSRIKPDDLYAIALIDTHRLCGTDFVIEKEAGSDQLVFAEPMEWNQMAPEFRLAGAEGI